MLVHHGPLHNGCERLRHSPTRARHGGRAGAFACGHANGRQARRVEVGGLDPRCTEPATSRAAMPPPPCRGGWVRLPPRAERLGDTVRSVPAPGDRRSGRGGPGLPGHRTSRQRKGQSRVPARPPPHSPRYTSAARHATPQDTGRLGGAGGPVLRLACGVGRPCDVAWAPRFRGLGRRRAATCAVPATQSRRCPRGSRSGECSRRAWVGELGGSPSRSTAPLAACTRAGDGAGDWLNGGWPEGAWARVPGSVRLGGNRLSGVGRLL